jgi:hypothetical protein
MNFKTLTAFLIALVLFSNAVQAIPGVSNAFYGTVTWNGQPAPDGTLVEARINGLAIASETTYQGKYGYPQGAFFVDNYNNDRTGKTINFFVNNVDTGKTSVFCNDCIIKLDLAATSSTNNISQSVNEYKQQNNPFSLTGFFLGISTTYWLIFILVGVIIVIIIAFQLTRKKSLPINDEKS